MSSQELKIRIASWERFLDTSKNDFLDTVQKKIFSLHIDVATYDLVNGGGDPFGVWSAYLEPIWKKVFFGTCL